MQEARTRNTMIGKELNPLLDSMKQKREEGSIEFSFD